MTYANLVWPSGYRNVTLVDDGVDSQSFVVGPNETTMCTVDGWTYGDVTVCIVERGDNRTHTWSRTVTCGSRGQDHGLRFVMDSKAGGSVNCTGGIGRVQVTLLQLQKRYGLWLVKRSVTRAGGTIKFGDADPQGSTVTLVLSR
ncbi:hypothetical protein [Natronorubrum aibiense]|uniref:hypothetical protein n=1 Tax=Natronorubrum aibiense TaxID=348826 RepID=UPI0029CA3F93|nr:hypothetical protein [Natronorubrum aibiense]